MNADLLFGNVEFFGAPSGQRVRVKLGESFTVNLNEGEEGLVWATTQQDRVLDVLDKGMSANVKADSIGNAEIQIQVSRQVVFYVTVEVYDPASVTSLNPSTSEPRQREA